MPIRYDPRMVTRRSAPQEPVRRPRCGRYCVGSCRPDDLGLVKLVDDLRGTSPERLYPECPQTRAEYQRHAARMRALLAESRARVAEEERRLNA